MCVCLFVLCRNPNGWTDQDEIWHRGGPQGGEGSWVFLPSTPTPRIQGASGASTMHFVEHFIKQKLQGTPNLVGVGHLFWPKIRIRKDLGQCLAIPTYFSYHTRLKNFNTFKYLF